MGSPGEDIILGDQSRAKFPYSVEAKHRQSYQGLYEAYYQAQANTPPGCEPVFMVKTNRDVPLAVITVDHFLALVSRNNKAISCWLESQQSTNEVTS